MTSKAKKRVVLPTRPEPPTIEQILEDIHGALPSDPVFLSMDETTEGSLQPPGREEECRAEKDREQQYQRSRSFVLMNQRLQEIQRLLAAKCEHLKQAGESLEYNIAEIKERAL
ncbi:UPF0449 protein C19orf25 homolog [Ambystoma mexicanum]|uniref:UPF0449 protein C19orf25 homolog n=1 Tax=Ambystoma mexicanum TaxID=8296 RepID=UPI0037E823D7